MSGPPVPDAVGGAGPVRPDPGDPLVGSLLVRCRFPAGPLACGLSGGPDSTALVALAVASGAPVRAVHVDHGLRPGAPDRDIAVATARRLGVDIEVVELELDEGPDLEERARRARYAALPPDVCVGHTADDRAETVVFNLVRGAGLAGVAAAFERVHRPLLALRRHETAALCAHLGLTVADDPTNADPRHTRSRLRHEVLPALAAATGRDPVPALCRHADLVADALAVIRDLAGRLDPTDVAALAAAPRAVAAEALRRWLAAETGAPRGVDAASIERVLAVVAGEIRATEVTGGHRVRRRAGRLRVEPRDGPDTGDAGVAPGSDGG